MKCGLLGRKLSHSYSPQIHQHLGNYSYFLFEKEPEEIEDFVKHGDYCGLNVTIPYKKDVLPFCDVLSETAKKMGAINTIVRKENGTLIGHNTDYFGFSQMLDLSGVCIRGRKVLVLGSGGASNTAVAVLNDYGANTVIISRSGENNYENLNRHIDAVMIVNTTPVGMYPNTGVAPIDLRIFPNLEFVLDMIYNPARTRLLQDAQQLGIPCMNGLLMLVAQAKESAQWFLNADIDNTVIPKILFRLRRQMENIILIGMPGCGKSTVGKLLSELTGKPFVDADAYLEDTYKRTIPEIFATDGESEFRKLETQVLADLSKRSGIILATGGGCVTRPENNDLLHQNGTVFCIQRDIALLATNGRPLSNGTNLEEMYKTRKPLYDKFADHFVQNQENAVQTAKQILKIWEAED